MYVAVMGYGVVGSGVVELFGKNHDSIVRRSTQTEMEIRYILDLRDCPGDPNEKKRAASGSGRKQRQFSL